MKEQAKHKTIDIIKKEKVTCYATCKETTKQGELLKQTDKKKINRKAVLGKEQEVAITLIALVVTIVVLLILAGITITFVLGENGIISMAKRVAEQTNGAMQNEQEDLANVTEQMQNYVNGGNDGDNAEIEEPPVPEEPAEEFSRANGIIDILFVNKANKIINASSVPTPSLGEGMVPVKWKEEDSSWYVCQSTDNTWYSYTEENKKWANVMLKDGLAVEGVKDVKTATIAEMAGKKVTTEGSMFVYIPRYAYKITYLAEDGNTILGYSNSDGIVDKEGAIVEGTKKVGAVKVTGKLGEETYIKYVLHPAFQKFEADELTQANGGWSSEIDGIWVAKFEASSVQGNSNNESGDDVTTKTIQVKPGVASWRYITINNMFTNCENYNKPLNSHMMKNSEWGAVAYLSKSVYGKNDEITINDNSFYYTGGESGTAYTSNTAQSTTGNVYGIYDMSGGSWEYVASYVNNESGSLTTYGASLVNSSNTNLKQMYELGSSDDREPHYQANKGKYGDAVYETSTAGTGSSSWYGDYSYFPYSSDPFFLRGGRYLDSSGAGAFAFLDRSGSSHNNRSFRPVLVVP